MERMRRNAPQIERLYRATPAARRVILKNASTDLMNALCEIALNVLKGTIPLSTKQYAQLRKKKSNVRLIADKRINITKKKKKLVNQKGNGFLIPLLAAAVPFLTNLFSRR